MSDIINSGKNAKSKDKNNTLGKDDFLKILITQLQNQDPTQPLQDKEFIAQMAQFTSVEQLTNMAGEMKLMRQSLGFVSGLIGKSITWTEIDSSGASVEKSGVVDSISFKDGNQYANVKGVEISLDKLKKIENVGETK
ncbi:flagellar hook capping FlgD N-terminal domain-containing protein [Paenibacillus alginolyticus]|uniref:flagellar hook capping FlgD N-terminal domain-containing protein n=1 Tax=Paenibacillus alginolyticus TaxID=59839 RepID=UPI002DBC4A20|nr:flagellar hook capping FlgD N-terminal domain-containing protein [Paenibacillus alginolyticus]MEC0143909.1 flagellar hook capping FlgD N-terminal domain-containing protein [Paenibacillus alginolyticus]